MEIKGFILDGGNKIILIISSSITSSLHSEKTRGMAKVKPAANCMGVLPCGLEAVALDGKSGE